MSSPSPEGQHETKLDAWAREIADDLPLEPASMTVAVLNCLHDSGYRISRKEPPTHA